MLAMMMNTALKFRGRIAESIFNGIQILVDLVVKIWFQIFWFPYHRFMILGNTVVCLSCQL